jgi:hypothetical protein
VHFGSPSPAAFGLRTAEFVPLSERTQNRIVVSRGVAEIARPSIVDGIVDYFYPCRVCLNVPQHHQQVRVILDDWALEAALPDVPRCTMAFVITPGVRHSQRLQDPADRLSGLRTKEQMEVIGHEAITEQSERIALAGLGEGIKECEAIGINGEDISAVIAPVEGTVDQAIIDRARKTTHSLRHRHNAGRNQLK